MNGNNFNISSYKDLQLGDQINQALNEYNSIARKIAESKNDLISNQNSLNNYFRSYKYNKIQPPKSPFISRGGDFLSTNTFYRKNNNISFNRNNETFYGTNHLIEDFKDTLEKSQIIKDDLLKSYRNNNKRKNKNYKANINYNKIPNSYRRNIMLQNNKALPNTRLNKYDKYENDNILSSLDDDDNYEDEKSNFSNGGNMVERKKINNFKNMN